VPSRFFIIAKNDDSHYSEEERGMLLFYTLSAILFGIVLGNNICNFAKEIKTYDRWESPHILLMTSISLHFLHIIFEAIHQWWYFSNGNGAGAFEVIASIF
jgi:hypothetical protein